MNTNRISTLFSIQYPIIQGGMVWCSGWKLASAVSNAGGLGLLGAGSMYPHVLLEHIQHMKQATDKPWGVNVPLLYPDIDALFDCIISQGVKIVFTSAGSPKTWTKTLQHNGITVVHVVSSTEFAKKSEDAGVDAIVAEGFEAGGHNGRDETTSLVLIPQVCKAVSVPVIAAGGIATGTQMFAAMAMGAHGVQVGSRFAVCAESSSHQNFKQAVYSAGEGDTMLSLKKVTPVRLLKNPFYDTISALEHNGASADELRAVLGRGRAKKGMFEGDLTEGELEIGQVASLISAPETAKEIIDDMVSSYKALIQYITNGSLDI